MAFNDLEKKRIEKAMDVFLGERRPPPHIRSDLDISYRLSDQSVEILEIRPQWNDRAVIREHPIAKATYVKTQKLWKVFLQRADMKWHGYEPALTVPSIDKFLAIVAADEYGCFFG